MHIHRLNQEGRRTAVVLLVSALIIWAFAIWMFSTMLVGESDAGFWAAASNTLVSGLGLDRIIPLVLLSILIVATPLAIWNILEEWAAEYSIEEDGLRYQSLGVALTYPWKGIVGLHRPEDESDETMYELRMARDYTRQIRNPLLRVLHSQAVGSRTLPIPTGLTNREALLDAIMERANLSSRVSPDAPPLEPETTR